MSQLTMIGTYGEVWINNVRVAEATGLQAKINFDKQAVPQAGSAATFEQVTGYSGKGSIRMNKVSSRMYELLKDYFTTGKMPDVTIVTKLKDPVFGSERFSLSGVLFDELVLSDWETKKLIEESIAFSFATFEPLDTITPSI